MFSRIISRGRFFFIAVMMLVIVLLIGCSGDPFSRRSSGLRVMTYNIHHGAGTDGKHDLARIAGVIAAAECDVIGLQEVDNNFGARSGFVDQAKWLAEKLDMHHVFAPAISSKTDAGLQLYGNAILSRYPIVRSTLHKLSAPAGVEPRVCLEAIIQIGGLDYTFMVTHLDHKSNTVRIQQTADILKAIPHPLERTVLMGDFNCQPPDSARDSKTAEPITRVLEKFEDSFVLSKTSYSESFEGEGRIDYIFVSPDLADNVLSNAVNHTEATAVASDHLPVVMEIRE
ncbi:MAG: endonuclease/exonuclease/phosphatase family protein [Planctomycetales bacterium]|nr:endonuclease/exonuclease/phosphatase family protein [Planctomycetales bacterium]